MGGNYLELYLTIFGGQVTLKGIREVGDFNWTRQKVPLSWHDFFGEFL